MKKIYKLKIDIETSKNKSFLKKKIIQYIKNYKFISSIAFAKKRKKVYIEKWFDVNIKQKRRYSINRLQSFFCWIELIKKADFSYKNDENQYEIIWLTPNGITIIVHLRKEKNNNKDKYIFYISSYFKD